MKTGFVRCAVIAALAVLVAPSCDIVGPKEARNTGPPKEAKTPEKIPVPKVAAPHPSRKRSAKTTAPPMAIPPHRPGPESKALVGKTEEELTKLLGVPSEVRNEPPALVWHYRSKKCSLDVFMYLDVGQESFRSLAYRFYPEIRVGWAQRKCLAGIRKARSRAGTSN